MRLRELADRLNELVVSHGDLLVIDENGNDIVEVAGPVGGKSRLDIENTIMLTSHIDHQLRREIEEEERRP